MSRYVRTPVRRPVRGGLVSLTLAAMLLSQACSSPADPTPTPGPPPPSPPAANPAPVISAVTVDVQNGRTEVDVDVPVSVAVTDAETSPAQLGYAWAANAGTIVGTGREVIWRLPKGSVSTPQTVTLTVTVSEPYQILENGAIVTRQHRVEASATPFRAHDSATEVQNLAMQFLGRFADNSVSPDVCVSTFSDNCDGKDAEREDIEGVRRGREVQRSQLTFLSAELSPARTDADVAVRCRFESVVIEKIDANDPYDPGDQVVTDGNCYLTAIYEQGSWRLCTSSFSGAEVRTSGTEPAGRRPTIAGALRGY